MLGWWVTKIGAISIKYKIILLRWNVIDRVFAWFKYPMSKCVPRSFLSFVIMNMFQFGQFYLATSWVVPQNKVAWILLEVIPFGNARSCEVLWPWKMFVRCFFECAIGEHKFRNFRVVEMVRECKKFCWVKNIHHNEGSHTTQEESQENFEVQVLGGNTWPCSVWKVHMTRSISILEFLLWVCVCIRSKWFFSSCNKGQGLSSVDTMS